MIIIVKKNNIVLIGLILLLSILLYSVNFWNGGVITSAKAPDSEKTILIDAGHGGEDPGAVSDYSGIKEKDANLEIALKLKELLLNENYKVIMSREEDILQYEPGTVNIVEKRKQDLFRRKKMMDEAGANIVVSIHMNKFPQTQYFGAQTFFPPGSPESQRLAASIQKALREEVDPGNQRESLVKKEPIIILRDYKTTTAIVECGFLSNQDEEKKISSSEYRQKLANAIKNGIVNYFNTK